MYRLYLCGIEWPLPSSVSIKSGGDTKTTKLLDGRTISFLKSPGLSEIGLSVDLPMFGERKDATYYTDKIKKFRDKKKPTQFILTRSTPDGKPLEDVNLKVSIGDFTKTENADDPFTMTVSVSLLEYVDYGTKTVSIKTANIGGKVKAIATISQEREKNNAPAARTYTVKDGDTLWHIAAKYLGSSSKYKDLFNANNLSDPNILKPGTELIIP